MRTEGYFALCLAFAMVCLAGAEIGNLLEKRRSSPRVGFIKQPQYCPVNPEVLSFLKQLRGPLDKALSQKDIGVSIQNSKISWIYNCLHAGLNVKLRVFEVATYECCKKCAFPAFSQCVGRSGDDAHSRCNSEALRCIAQCILTKGQNSCRPPIDTSRICGTTVGKDGNSDCLQRSCISI